MNVQLIEGEFSATDAYELLSQMVQTKIKFHETKIAKCSNEEDVKYRESRIKRLQYELAALRNALPQYSGNVKLFAHVKLEL